ncbi:MAG: hypothetical protein ACM3JP_02685 [Betaproteobacteria bacterium]
MVRRVLLLGLSTFLFTAACAGTGPPPGSEPRSGTSSASVNASAEADIFIAVLHRYLTSPGENSFPDTRFPVVYVLDHTDSRAADPMRTTVPPTGAPISLTDQRRIVAALHDVATIRFVAARSEVVVRDNGCDRVQGGGILILLAAPVGGPDHVQVGINGFVACLGATWLTYVVQRGTAGWTATGTTGAAAIS